VTIPHKENALKYLKSKGAEIEPLAERIGAVNTIIIDREVDEVRLRGMNTDYAAILDSITKKLNISRHDLAKLRIAILGGGGTGRTAVAALAHYGASITIYNRTKDRADALAAEFNGKSGAVVAVQAGELGAHVFDVLINTTSVGMYPKVDASPLDGQENLLKSTGLVFDTVYNPVQTKLLSAAASAGAKTINGVEMFVRQAAGQFEAWTKIAAPREVMRRVVEERLA
jgi:shikimate dehydrogenase